MDWTQVFVTILVFLGSLFAFVIYLSGKIDNVKTDLSKEIQSVKTDLTKEIQKNREDILWLKFRMDPYEHPNWRKEEPKEE